MSNRIKYTIFAVGSFILGIILYYTNQVSKPVDSDFNKTLAKHTGDKYFLVFNSIVVLTREVSPDQYNYFLKQYPSGKAPNNVLDQFSTPADTKFTYENGKFYEYVYKDGQYQNPIEITKEEYDSRRNSSALLTGEIGHM